MDAIHDGIRLARLLHPSAETLPFAGDVSAPADARTFASQAVATLRAGPSVEARHDVPAAVQTLLGGAGRVRRGYRAPPGLVRCVERLVSSPISSGEQHEAASRGRGRALLASVPPGEVRDAGLALCAGEDAAATQTLASLGGSPSEVPADVAIALVRAAIATHVPGTDFVVALGELGGSGEHGGLGEHGGSGEHGGLGEHGARTSTAGQEIRALLALTLRAPETPAPSAPEEDAWRE